MKYTQRTRKNKKKNKRKEIILRNKKLKYLDKKIQRKTKGKS